MANHQQLQFTTNMARLYQFSKPDPQAKTKKRVSFAPNQSTACPPPPKPSDKDKKVRFTKDTKPSSRSDSRSATSSKTRWPSPPSKPAAQMGDGPGLSSVRRDFDDRKKSAMKTSRPPPTEAPKPSSSRPRKSSSKPDVRVSIPACGGSYDGPPKARHQRSGYEWISYEIRVKPTGKDWRRERWAK